jgi:hypothetical protein
MTVLIEPEIVDILVEPQVVDIVVESPPIIELELTPDPVEVVIAPETVQVDIGSGWIVVEGGPELFDTNAVPAAPPDTYLRFERDVDGDIQAVYLGTVD